LPDRSLRKLIHGHSQSLSNSLQHTVSLRIAETQDHLGGGFFAHGFINLPRLSPTPGASPARRGFI
jgi:hypothetical protein